MSVSFLYLSVYHSRDFKRFRTTPGPTEAWPEALTVAWPVPHIAWRCGEVTTCQQSGWKVVSWVEWHGNDMGITCHGQTMPNHSVHNTQLMISWYLMHSHAHVPITSYVPLGNITWLSWHLMTTSAGKRHSPGSTNGLQVQDLSRETIELTIDLTYELRIQDWIIISHRIHVWYICKHKGDILMVNVTIYSIHGSYGYRSSMTFSQIHHPIYHHHVPTYDMNILDTFIEIYDTSVQPKLGFQCQPLIHGAAPVHSRPSGSIRTPDPGTAHCEAFQLTNSADQTQQVPAKLGSLGFQMVLRLRAPRKTMENPMVLP